MGRRCLIIGESGQLGRALHGVFRDWHQVIGAAYQAPPRRQIRIDLGDPAGAVATVRELDPEWILIAGAFCNVDQCEIERERCFRVNVEGPRAIAAYARTCGATVVYYSTDSVFDGAQDHYREEDPVHPLNVYSQSKALGEAAVRQSLPERSLVLRTAWLYGPDDAQRNFILTLIGELSQGHPVTVPMDQYGSPSFTEDLASATRYLLERGHTGTFHATGPESLSREALARAVCHHFGLDERLIQAKTTAELGQRARRPSRVWLDCAKLRATGAPPFRSIGEGLEALKGWYTTAVR